MNLDIIKGNWKEIKGKLKQHWGKITDNDLMKIEGSYEQLQGCLQKRYGYSQQEAKKEIDEFINQGGWAF